MKFKVSLMPLTTKKIKDVYDVIVIGGGPAGCTAALYLRRFLLDTLVISKEFGGLLNEAGLIDNYPTVPEIMGSSLGERFVKHAEKYGATFLMEEVVDVSRDGEYFNVKTYFRSVKARALIIATGEVHKKLDVPGEEEFSGRGVSYCAVCDAPLFKNKIVAVVGGGNTAFTDAQLLSKYADKVYLIHRRTWFRADPIEVSRVKSNPKIVLRTPFIVKEIRGREKVEELLLEKTREEKGKVIPVGDYETLKIDGVFVDIGLIPNSSIAKKLGVKLDEHGYIIVDDEMKTNVPGVFAAGDVTNIASKFRQIIIAAAQGAIASYSAYNYLRGKKDVNR